METFVSVAPRTVPVRVLIAAAGEPGETASETLAAAGFTVERVTAFDDARVRAATAPVAVVGPLSDTAPDELRDALREGGVATPLVRLGPGEGYTATVAGPAAEELPAAVRLARHAGEYQDAVDEFFERCRARAEGEDDGDEAFAAARERAAESLRETRRVAGRTPYEFLLEE